MTTLVMAVGAAGAQDAPAPDLSDEEARNLFEAGRSAFIDGRFEAALGHFQGAYELSERPVLLFNIASCLDRLRRDAEAVDYFERYLEAIPDAENRTEVEGRLRILRAEIAEGGAAEDGGGGRLFTWISLAAAVALGGAAVGTWLAGNGEESSLRASCADRAPSGCSDDEVGTLRTLDTLTNVFLFTAIGAAVLSVVLFFVEGGESGSETSAALRVSPFGAELSGRF